MISKYMRNRRPPQSGLDLHKQELTGPSVGMVWGKARGGDWWTMLEEGDPTRFTSLWEGLRRSRSLEQPGGERRHRARGGRR